MNTSAQAAQITEVPLLRILTVKRKHLKGLLDLEWRTWPSPDPKLIGYVTEWSSLLVQKDNGHIAVIRDYVYTEHVATLRRKEGNNDGNKEAWETIQALPQLFLD